jgi:hypothetical protein
MKSSAGPPWADLVFHVLAHVEATETLPSSVSDEAYRTFVEAHLGPASERALGGDARVLGDVLRDHAELSRVQTLAGVFRDAEHAARVRGRDLTMLMAEDVAEPVFLESAKNGGAAMEVLRAAAELEAPFHARLPPVRTDLEAFDRALQARAVCAPLLTQFRISCLRSLRLRGRVVPGHIWVGAPGVDPPLTALHAAWQACHEATVAEVGAAAARRGLAIVERTVEHAAIVLLTVRAAENGLSADHDTWCATFGSRMPNRDIATLPNEAQQLLKELEPAIDR